jgi:plasmid stabilization system protein ParE
MTGIAIRFHLEAASEVEAAVAWYAERSVRAAERFIEELTSTLAMIAEAPHQWTRFEGNTRRVVLRHYPFVVIYRAFPDFIEILAVAHGRRRPGYWRDREH